MWTGLLDWTDRLDYLTFELKPIMCTLKLGHMPETYVITL